MPQDAPAEVPAEQAAGDHQREVGVERRGLDVRVLHDLVADHLDGPGARCRVLDEDVLHRVHGVPGASRGGEVAGGQACSYNSRQPNSNGVDCAIDAGNPWTIDLGNGMNMTPQVPVELQSFVVE